MNFNADTIQAIINTLQQIVMPSTAENLERMMACQKLLGNIKNSMAQSASKEGEANVGG